MLRDWSFAVIRHAEEELSTGSHGIHLFESEFGPLPLSPLQLPELRDAPAGTDVCIHNEVTFHPSYQRSLIRTHEPGFDGRVS